MNLNTLLDQIYGIGSNIYKRLQKLGLNTAKDALFYYPFRYEDFSNIKKISDLVDGETTTIRGKIILLNNKRSPRKKMNLTEVLIEDDSSQIQVIWFNQPFIKNNLSVGEEIFLSGTIKKSLMGLSMTNPGYEKTLRDTTHTARIVPIYPTTENLTQKQLRYIIKKCLPVSYVLEDSLPSNIIEKEGLMSLDEAIRQIHFPENDEVLEKARKRLSFDEVFYLLCLSKAIKNENQKNSAPIIKFQEEKIKKFVRSLPFELTKSQKISAWDIFKDLEKNIPMNRLLEGDVGSGKTIVAIMTAYNTILNGYQSIFMAPTQILAKQHFEKIIQIFKNSDISICLFTNKERLVYNGKTKTAKTLSKIKIIEEIKNGKINITIGTHSIIGKDVEFSRLGLVIVDEQHRFGVRQRHELLERSKNLSPHFLSMTATPIPRSLALTIYGDLDISRITEKPVGRKKIITRLVSDKNRSRAYEFIYRQIESGRQAFVICPLINESDKLGVKSVLTEYEKLNNDIFPNLDIKFLHGKMKEIEKNEILKDFSDNKTKILVSTSVIEVGIDYPNASIMIIEGADRFGLASLHQFRGRVGRGEHQSYCFLFTDNYSKKTTERLQMLESTDDGFKLSEFDLKTRGSGNLYGNVQSGFLSQIKIADLSDFELIKKAQKWTNEIFINDPELTNHKELKDKMGELIKNVHLE